MYNIVMVIGSNKKSLLFNVSLLAVLGGLCFSVDTFAYTSSISVNGSVEMDLLAGGDGAAVKADNLTISTTCPFGYTVSIGGNADNALYLNNNGSDSTNKIMPSSGTAASPTSIVGNNQNTWGFSITANTVATSSNFIGLTSGVQELKSSGAVVVPDGGAYTETLPVYYGASVSSSLAVGSYGMKNSGNITYYLTPSQDCMSYTVSFNANGGTGTMSTQRIFEGVTDNLTANGFTAPTGYYFAGWNTQANGSGTAYGNMQAVTDIVPVGTNLPLYAQWTDCPAGHICYKGNGADSGTSMQDQTTSDYGTNLDEAEDEETTLMPSNYKKAGYGFAGWNTKSDYSGTFYGPSQTIIPPNLSDGGYPLYAVWVASAGNMQNWNGCSSLTSATYSNGVLSASLSSVTALTDTRDSKTYAVARLSDGNCWMIENLKLDNTSQLSSDNTRSPSLPLTNDYANSTTSNYLSATSSIWCGTESAACDDQSMLNTVNTVSTVSSMSSMDENVYSYGNYYNWYSATAGHGTFAKTSGDTTGDICPKGWKLPAGEENASAGFSALDLSMGGAGYSQTGSNGLAQSAKWRSFPNNYIYSGFFDPSDNQNSPTTRGRFGYYWTKTAYDNDYSLDLANFLQVGLSALRPGTQGSYKYNGFAVRCISGS